MPESRVRRKADYTPPPRRPTGPGTSPRWYAPVMVALFVLGLAWIVVYYLTQEGYPVPGIGAWNLVAGFAIVMAGFAMATRWR